MVARICSKHVLRFNLYRKLENELDTKHGYGYQVWKGLYEDGNGAVATVTVRQELDPYKIIPTIDKEIIERI